MTSKTGSLIASSIEFEDDNNQLKKKNIKGSEATNHIKFLKSKF